MKLCKHNTPRYISFLPEQSHNHLATVSLNDFTWFLFSLWILMMTSWLIFNLRSTGSGLLGFRLKPWPQFNGNFASDFHAARIWLSSLSSSSSSAVTVRKTFPSDPFGHDYIWDHVSWFTLEEFVQCHFEMSSCACSLRAISVTASGCVFNCTFMELKSNWESGTNTSLRPWFSCSKSKSHPTWNWELGTWSSLPYTLVLATAPERTFRAAAKGKFKRLQHNLMIFQPGHSTGKNLTFSWPPPSTKGHYNHM